MNRGMSVIFGNHGTNGSRGRLPGKQKGAYTMFSAVLILILLTEMIIYAVQTGVFEQRKSANEMRQKEAFHIADSAVQAGKEFMLSNSIFVPSSVDDLLPNGSDGWLSTTGQRWFRCDQAGLSAAQGDHPCYGEPADNTTDFPADLRNNMYYYSFGTVDAAGNAKDLTELPIDVGGLLADATQQVSLYALLCMLDIDREKDPIIQGCTLAASDQDTRYHMVTVLARGEADCDGGTCTAKALITDKIGSYGPGGGDGGGGVPLTTRSNFPPTGNAEIVPNPNGGGIGVPISAWMNTNTECLNQVVVDAEEGSWSTCERHEWYGVDIMPGDYKCPGASSNCDCGNKEKKLSWAKGKDTHFGIDLVEDDGFPCDLFLQYFGVNKDPEGIDFVKTTLAKEVLDDCSSLDENSFGVYWVSGPTCIVNANTQVGSSKAPVFLISAAGLTRFNGGATLFGVLFVTDAEISGAEFQAIGSMTIYGAAVIDGVLGKYSGTFQVVYVDTLLATAMQTGGLGNVAGGWADFHADWQ